MKTLELNAEELELIRELLSEEYGNLHEYADVTALTDDEKRDFDMIADLIERISNV